MPAFMSNFLHFDVFGKIFPNFVLSGFGILLVQEIQDFPEVGASTSKFVFFVICFAENCIKMKEFGRPGASLAPPLEPPMLII